MFAPAIEGFSGNQQFENDAFEKKSLSLKTKIYYSTGLQSGIKKDFLLKKSPL